MRFIPYLDFDGNCKQAFAFCAQAFRGNCINAQVTDPAGAERIFAALAAGGPVQMPLQETSWALRCGMVTDRCGKAWMVNCGKPMV